MRLAPNLWVACIALIAYTGCGGGGSSAAQQHPTAPAIATFGHMNIARKAPMSLSAQRLSALDQATAPFLKPYFMTGKDTDGNGAMVYVIPDGSSSPKTLPVIFTDGQALPSPYPCSFTWGGDSYLLFAGTKFGLYTISKDMTDEVDLSPAGGTFDFSALDRFLASYFPAYPKNSRNVWISCATFSPALKTIYFTAAWWVVDSKIGDYVKVALFKSTLGGDSKTFATPTPLAGQMDPYDAVHYLDGKAHTPDEFSDRKGLWWIGRMYVTADGTKAYFNVLNTAATKATIPALKPGDPFVAPTPNNQDLDTSNTGVTDVKDPKVVYTYTCVADIGSTGGFTNIRQLPAVLNSGGVNYISDISDDGTMLVMSHMELDSNWWATYGSSWGPDGMARQLTMSAPWEVAPWNGCGTVWLNNAGTWTKVYSTR